MNKCILITLIAALCLPITVGAQVFRCKTANGTWAFGDRPCPDASPLPAPAKASARASVERMGYPRAAPEQAPLAPSAREAPAPYPPKRRELSAHSRNELREFEKRIAEMPANMANLCEAGDKNACVASICIPFDMEKGKQEEFRACARARNQNTGSYWSLLKGRPEFTPSDTEELVRKLGVGNGFTDTVELKCFRKKTGLFEVSGSHAYATLKVDIVKGATGPEVKRMYLPKDASNGRVPVPHFSSLERLADHVCEK